MDKTKYADMADHDLLIVIATQQAEHNHHLEKINGQIDAHCGDIIKLKLIIGAMIASGIAGAGKLIGLIG